MSLTQRLQPGTQYLRRGEALPFDLEASATAPAVIPDWSVVAATVILDGPTQADGSAGLRHTFRWRPDDDSDTEFTYSGTHGDPLMFDADPTWTADEANLYVGEWILAVAIGSPGIDQDEIGYITLVVYDLPNGPWPTDI